MLSLLRNATLEQLRDEEWLTDAIVQMGLEHHPGVSDRPGMNWGGLRIWQTPIQFAPYLIALSGLGIRSYVELGVHAGGSMMATVEYLDRFARVERILGVDMTLQHAEPVLNYARERPGLSLLTARTDDPEVEGALFEMQPDLVFIDAEHAEWGCRADWELARRYARFVGFHDIVDFSCSGPDRVWASINGAPKREFVAQYDGSPPIHGIGLVGPLR